MFVGSDHDWDLYTEAMIVWWQYMHVTFVLFFHLITLWVHVGTRTKG